MTGPLEPHYRGDTFDYDFTIGSGWVFADFTGGLKFTLRTREPSSSTVADTDATDQATSAGGEVTGSGAAGNVLIPASRTTAWPSGRLYWDLQGIVTGTPNRVYTIDKGTIVIVADITRGQ
jgi:hypothetical protein